MLLTRIPISLSWQLSFPYIPFYHCSKVISRTTIRNPVIYTTMDATSRLVETILFTLCLFLIVVFLTLASFFCTHFRTHRNSPQVANARNTGTNEVGLDESTLHSFPKVLYGQSKLKKSSSTSTCCSICLMEYKETDMLQLMPDCGHLFHLHCINSWLRLHPTCPICRNLPVPIPGAIAPVNQVPLLATQVWFEACNIGQSEYLLWGVFVIKHSDQCLWVNVLLSLDDFIYNISIVIVCFTFWFFILFWKTLNTFRNCAMLMSVCCIVHRYLILQYIKRVTLAWFCLWCKGSWNYVVNC